MLHCVALVRMDVSEECSTSIIMETRIGELETTLAVTTIDARCKEILCENGSLSMEYWIGDAERSINASILTQYFLAACVGC
jgi:hypothetical protein